MKPVQMYSTKVCKYCKAAEEFFNQNNIKFEKFDVGADAVKRAEMVEKSGQLGVPVITVGDDVVIGFNEPILKQLLSIA